MSGLSLSGRHEGVGIGITSVVLGSVGFCLTGKYGGGICEGYMMTRHEVKFSN